MSVDAIVLEALPGLELGSDEAREAIERELAGRAGGWIYNILSKSVSLGLDFLGLGRRLERGDPGVLARDVLALELDAARAGDKRHRRGRAAEHPRVCRGAGLEWHV